MSARVFLWERLDSRDQSIGWLGAQGCEVRTGRLQDDPALLRYPEQQLIADAADCEALIGSGGARITRAVIEALPGLRVISKIGVGVDNIDVAAATARGVVVCHTPDEDDSATVAEHALALMLALVKQLPQWPVSHVRQGGWRTPAVFTGRMTGRTVGIVGFGRIGRALAQRLQGWGVELLCHDLVPGEPVAGVRPVSLSHLLQASDVVTLHCPSPGDGHPLLDAAAIASMRQGALLVNTARAALVDTAALADALHRGHLGGAAVDVFHPEPPAPNDPLLQAPRTILTPHVASWTHEGYFRRRQVAAENAVKVLRGLPGAHVVRPQVLS